MKVRLPKFGRKKKGVPLPQVRSWDAEPDALVTAAGRPDLTFSVLMGIAARSGREEGRQAAGGRVARDKIEDLPARDLLKEKVGERKSYIQRSATTALEQVRSSIRGLEARKEAAERRHSHTHEIEGKERGRLEDHEQSIHDSDNPHPPPRLEAGYWMILIVLALVEFPTIYQSLQGSIIEQWAIYIISAALSIIVAICAHTVGSNLAKYVEATRILRQGKLSGGDSVDEVKVDRNVHLIIVVVITFMIIALMIAVFETRTSLFDGLVANRDREGFVKTSFNAGLLSTTFFVLQVLLFLLATAVAFNRSKHEDERRSAKQHRKRKRELEKEEDKAEKKSREHAEDYEAVLHALELATNSSSLIEANLQSRLDQEEHFLRALLAEHDLAFEAGKREGPSDLPPDPTLFASNPPSEFRTIEVD